MAAALTLHAVIRERGPGWDDARPMREQPRWDEHAAFMDSLAAEGFVLFGGPLGDGTRVLHVVDAEDAVAIAARLALDPWAKMGVLRTADIQPWQILLGEPPAARRPGPG
jgi:uncharacterized protein YciI